VLVARNGNVIMHKSYGFLTYDSTEILSNEHIYDLASVTKITASLPALIYYESLGKFSIYDKISDYYKPWQKSNKEEINFLDALTHQARLTPWIPFYKETSPFGILSQRVFSEHYSGKYPYPVAKEIYVHRKYHSIILEQIKNSPQLEKKEMKYSDLSFYIYPELIKKWSKRSFDQFLNEKFYSPLGMDRTFFNAHHEAELNQIVPTEIDSFFRMQLLRGYVHDEGAAMLGGISGHAGLFSTANDLAKLMQLYLNGGEYAGQRYFSDSVFTKYYSRPFAAENNRKGIGFDKSYFNNQKLALANAFPAPASSESSYGHGGFTGTFIWLDPEFNLIFIFLSNRVFPSRDNPKLYQLNIRPAMHQSIYDAFM
jgi:CubicO group peptidase (beta-lactamase class C family)